MRIIKTEYIPVAKEEICLTEEEREDLCCGSVVNPGDITCCTKITPWSGYGPEEIREIYDFPEDWDLREEPRETPCGEQHRIIDLEQKLCCEGVDVMEWDYVNSSEWVNVNSNASVAVTKGKGPFSWKVRGDGFYTNSGLTQRDIITTGNEIYIFTGAYACGSCSIEVVDSCGTTVSGTIKSTLGSWDPINNADCPLNNVTPDSLISWSLLSTGNPCGIHTFKVEAIEEEYKVQQDYYTDANSVSGPVSICSNPIYSPEVLAAALLDSMKHRKDPNFINPNEALSGSMVNPVDFGYFPTWPWTLSGDGTYYYVDCYNYSGSSYVTAVFVAGIKSSCVSLTQADAWEWVC